MKSKRTAVYFRVPARLRLEMVRTAKAQGLTLTAASIQAWQLWLNQPISSLPASESATEPRWSGTPPAG